MVTRMDVYQIAIVCLSFGLALCRDLLGGVPLLTNTIPEPPRRIAGHAEIMSYPIDHRLPGFMRYTPKKKHLKPKKLRRLLGDSYDESFMSIDTPDTASRIVHVRTVDGKTFEKLTSLNFTFTDRLGDVVPLNATVVELFQQWLLTQASCPVHYMWEDLGNLFWPRWLRRGFCVKESSCSWPPGMHCVPSESKLINLLRWHCRRPNRKKSAKRDRIRNDNAARKRKHYKKLKCNWIKVPYPVTAECFCSC